MSIDAKDPSGETRSTEGAKESTPSPTERAESWPPLVSLRRKVDRLFDEFGGGLFAQPISQRERDLLPSAAGWTVSPETDLTECDGEYRITSELPGMEPDDLEIRLTEGAITIRGRKSEEATEEQGDYLVSERRYGEFRRRLPLPRGIDADAVRAQLSKGVLTVTLPKSPDAAEKDRRIEVEAGA